MIKLLCSGPALSFTDVWNSRNICQESPAENKECENKVYLISWFTIMHLKSDNIQNTIIIWNLYNILIMSYIEDSKWQHACFCIAIKVQTFFTKYLLVFYWNCGAQHAGSR